MISIIIASTNQQLLDDVQKSIEQTVGCAYELLIFENANGRKSICQVYNEGASQARYPLLCFMHEDVAFQKEGWGNVVIELFNKNSRLGVLGIAGSTYKSVTPSGWFAYSHVIEMEHSNLVQSYKYKGSETVQNTRNPSNTNPAKVATVDGVWMCTTKNIALCHPFDEKTYQKFHCYDIDFCITVGRFYDIAVTYDVLLHHLSDGNFDGEWMRETMKMHKKWKDALPVSTISLTKKQLREIEKQNLKYWVRQMRKFKFSIWEAIGVLHIPGVRSVLGRKYFLKYHYTIFSIYYREETNR